VTIAARTATAPLSLVALPGYAQFLHNLSTGTGASWALGHQSHFRL